MNRAYGLKQHANAGKQSKAIETVRAYRKTAEKIARVQWRFFYGTGGGFDKHLAIKHIASFLSERYKQTCQYQVVGILASFLSNRQNDFVDLVKRSFCRFRHKVKKFRRSRVLICFLISSRCSSISRRLALQLLSYQKTRLVLESVSYHCSIATFLLSRFQPPTKNRRHYHAEKRL